VTRRLVSLSVAAILVVAACSSEPALSVNLSEDLLPPGPAQIATGEDTALMVGFDERLEPKEDVRINASLLTWLDERTGLAFRLHTPHGPENVAEQLCSGEIDFAIAGTVSYLQANDRCDARMLVRGISADGDDTYRAAIIVRATKAIDDIGELGGDYFAFGAPNSTQGHLIPRLMLQSAGISLADLGGTSFTGSHAATAKAVTSGSFDAGAIQDTLAVELASRDLVRILGFSDSFPSSGVVVGPNVSPEVVEIVRRALLDLDPMGPESSALYHWSRSEMPRGFVAADDADYEVLRTVAREVGLLGP
jgi:phosphonate transport system substrate-binding protein